MRVKKFKFVTYPGQKVTLLQRYETNIFTDKISVRLHKNVYLFLIIIEQSQIKKKSIMNRTLLKNY